MRMLLGYARWEEMAKRCACFNLQCAPCGSERACVWVHAFAFSFPLCCEHLGRATRRSFSSSHRNQTGQSGWPCAKARPLLAQPTRRCVQHQLVMPVRMSCQACAPHC